MKNQRLLTRKATTERRNTMLVKVLSFNISKNHLSRAKKEYLSELFKEAKYYYNYLLALTQVTIIDDFGNLIYPNKLKNIDTKNNIIAVFNSLTQTSFDYEIKYLSSQMKQKILDKANDNIKGLSVAKSKGRKTGKLKFKSSVNVPLKQLNNTFYLDDDLKYLTIQGFKSHFKLYRNKALLLLAKELGFPNLSLNDLIDSDIIEVANAELIKNGTRNNLTYQFKLTIYINPEIYESNNLIVQKSISKPRINKNRLHKNSINTNETHINQNNINTLITPVEELKETQLSQSIKQFQMNFTQEQQELISRTCVGIDAGIASELTFSFNELFDSVKLDSRNNRYLINVLKEIKSTQTKLNMFIQRSKKLNKKELRNISSNIIHNSSKSVTYNKSRAYYDILNKLNKLWTKYEHIKDNVVNHIISYLKSFKTISFQDEMIKTWHQDTLRGYGKKIQAGILGKLYAKLKLLHISDPEKYIMLSKSEKTTQTCANFLCQHLNPISLEKRVYNCHSCGYENDRDGHSAYNMINMNNKNLTSNDLNNNAINAVQESGRDSVNLVQELTSINKTELNYFVIVDKLVSKSYINATLNSFI